MAMMTAGCNRVAATSIDGRRNAVDLKVEPIGADATVWV